jgi:acyl dehydratase
VGPDLVTVSDIRRKLEVVGLDCPLHYDEACARSFGYRTIVAPVSMTRVWATAPTWRPGEPRPRAEVLRTLLPSADPPGHGDTLLAAHVATEHHEPVHVGDRVSGVAVLKSVTPKRTRVGSGAFMVIETTYVNQDQRVLTVERATLFRFDRGDSDRAAPESTPPGPEHVPEGTAASGRVRGVRDYDDVTPGESLPPFRMPLTLQRLVMEAGANRDFSPWHFDREVALATGAPAVSANTTLIETLLEAGIRCWAGLAARIRLLEFAIKGHNCAGDVVSVGGIVTGKGAEHGEHRVSLDVWIDSPRARTVTGSAVVSMPAQ